MSEEWSEWQEHDGKGCPCVGRYVQVVMLDGDTDQEMADEFVWEYEDLGHFFQGYITRYRIRKPRALRDLIEMVENLPAPTRKMDA